MENEDRAQIIAQFDKERDVEFMRAWLKKVPPILRKKQPNHERLDFIEEVINNRLKQLKYEDRC